LLHALTKSASVTAHVWPVQVERGDGPPPAPSADERASTAGGSAGQRFPFAARRPLFEPSLTRRHSRTCWGVRELGGAESQPPSAVRGRKPAHARNRGETSSPEAYGEGVRLDASVDLQVVRRSPRQRRLGRRTAYPYDRVGGRPVARHLLALAGNAGFIGRESGSRSGHHGRPWKSFLLGESPRWIHHPSSRVLECSIPRRGPRSCTHSASRDPTALLSPATDGPRAGSGFRGHPPPVLDEARDPPRRGRRERSRFPGRRKPAVEAFSSHQPTALETEARETVGGGRPTRVPRSGPMPRGRHTTESRWRSALVRSAPPRGRLL